MTIILGLTGKNGAGKTSTADCLKGRGFYYLSLSDIIRDELKKENLPETRENLIAKGNELRKKHGFGILAERTAHKLEKDRNYAIDSIRAKEEVEELQKLKGFKLIALIADEKTRFLRLKERKRIGDVKSLEEFIEAEKKELSGKKGKQNLEWCEKNADYLIDNNGTIMELQKLLDELLAKMPQNFDRPDWDSYFMAVAKVVSTRSNCVKRKVAAVIVRDKRIISTGYNGTPRNTRNCNEGGCARCNNFAESGTKLEECLCSHGEENAIVQAAYHGIALKDSTIYTTSAPASYAQK